MNAFNAIGPEARGLPGVGCSATDSIALTLFVSRDGRLTIGETRVKSLTDALAPVVSAAGVPTGGDWRPGGFVWHTRALVGKTCLRETPLRRRGRRRHWVCPIV